MKEKGPRCNPFRVPGAKLEERVWREILSLIEKPSHRQRRVLQRIASESEYERLLDRLKSRLTDLSPESKRGIIQTLVQKIVVTATGFELNYFVGVEQIKKGETFVSPSLSLSKNYFALGSVKGWKLENGILTPHVRQQLAIAKMKKLRSRGQSFKKIAQALNQSAASDGAELLARVFAIDMKHCPNCGSENFKPIAAIMEVQGILRRLCPSNRTHGPRR